MLGVMSYLSNSFTFFLMIIHGSALTCVIPPEKIYPESESSEILGFTVEEKPSQSCGTCVDLVIKGPDEYKGKVAKYIRFTTLVEDSVAARTVVGVGGENAAAELAAELNLAPEFGYEVSFHYGDAGNECSKYRFVYHRGNDAP